jgi:anaerobic C4-dicarboxylate transporter DcuA/anaerobic C4-dicarboxylate transporter DcuB
MLLWIELALLLALFVFRLEPGGSPGITELGMILAVITAISAMQAASGLDHMVSAAGRMPRCRPLRFTGTW